MNNNKLVGKNILITAGGQGIGESITRHFIDSGANVAIHYFTSGDTANSLKDYAISKGQKAVAIGGDLTNEADANALVAKTIDAFKGLDILINNAGSLVARKKLGDIDTEFWYKVMDINLTSMMFVTRAAAPYLAKNENSSIDVNFYDTKISFPQSCEGIFNSLINTSQPIKVQELDKELEDESLVMICNELFENGLLAVN